MVFLLFLHKHISFEIIAIKAHFSTWYWNIDHYPSSSDYSWVEKQTPLTVTFEYSFENWVRSLESSSLIWCIKLDDSFDWLIGILVTCPFVNSRKSLYSASVYSYPLFSIVTILGSSIFPLMALRDLSSLCWHSGSGVW